MSSILKKERLYDKIPLSFFERMNEMYNKLKAVEEKFNELTEKISDPAIIEQQSLWQKLMKERAEIEDVVEKYREFKQVRTDIDSAKELLNDKELHELAQMEILTGEEKLIKIEEELKKAGKDYTFYRYDDAGHGIWYYDKPMYRQAQAMDSFERCMEFFDKHLK